MCGSKGLGYLLLATFAVACHFAVGLDDYELVDDEGTASSSSVGGSGGATSSSSVSSSSSGPMGCDTRVGGGNGSQACNDCIQCSTSMECQNEWSACLQGTPCDDFIVCLSNCDANCGGDQVCFDMCVGPAVCDGSDPPGTCSGDHAQGCADYINALGCSICVACEIDCDAASSCGGN